MRVLCWCGEDFEHDGTIAQCPKCFAVTTLPRVSTSDAEQMEREVQALISQIEGNA